MAVGIAAGRGGAGMLRRPTTPSTTAVGSSGGVSARAGDGSKPPMAGTLLARRGSAPGGSHASSSGRGGVAAPEYALNVGTPGAREMRARMLNRAKWSITSESITGVNAAKTVHALFTDVQEEWRAANAANKVLLEDMFSTSASAAQKQEAALLWVGALVATEGAEDLAVANTDLLLKYAAVTLLDVKEKTSMISGALVCSGLRARARAAEPRVHCLRSFLSLCSQPG
ncbi:hypothetical protein EON66_10405 [archaeon]|nr:MAG: hypothetical protein EON66_10405 [archaeon]